MINNLSMVIRVLLILILLNGINAKVKSQHLQIQWQQCYGGSGEEFAYDVVSTNGGYIVAGETTSSDGDISYYHGGANDAWVIRTDEYGNLMWERAYGGTVGEIAHRIFHAANSKNYYLVCSSGSSDGDINEDPYNALDYWIVKIDSTGNILWDKIVGGNGFDQVWTGTATLDGGIVAFGWSASDDGDISNPYGLFDMWMIKLDSTGQKEWDYSIGTSSLEYGEAMIETSDGGFLVGGASGPVGEDGNIDCTPHSYYRPEAILFKLDSAGNEEWQQCYGGSGDEGIIGLLEVEDGYLFSAYSTSNDGDVEGSVNHGEGDIWLVKTDFEGNIVWQNCYGGTNYEYAVVMFQTTDEGYMVFGATQSKNGDVIGNHSSTDNNYSIWVFKINSTGELLWQQCIGGLGTEEVQYGVIQKSDHDYVIAGTMQYTGSYDVDCPDHMNDGNFDYWLFEVKDTTVNIVETEKEAGFSVYPNPAGKKFKVESLPAGQAGLKFKAGEWQLEVYDLYGRKVKELQIPKGQSEVEVDASGWNTGVYVLLFRDGSKIVGKEKILLSR